MLSVRPNKNTGSSQDIEGIVSPYDYANQRDADNFCPVNPDSAPVDSDNDDHHDPGMTFADQTAEFASQGDGTKTFGPFSGDNLVAAPNMVNIARIQCSIILTNRALGNRSLGFKLIMPKWQRKWI